MPGGGDIASLPPVSSGGPNLRGRASPWRLGAHLLAEATGAGALMLARLHRTALPRLAALGSVEAHMADVGPQLAEAGRCSGRRLVVARAGASEWLAWVPDAADAKAVRERWLTLLHSWPRQAAPLFLRCQPCVACQPWPVDGGGRMRALEALRSPADTRAGVAALAQPSCAPPAGPTAVPGCRETLQTAQAMCFEPVIDLVAGRVVGWRFVDSRGTTAIPEAGAGDARTANHPARLDARARQGPTRVARPVSARPAAPTDPFAVPALAGAARCEIPVVGGRPGCLILPESIAWCARGPMGPLAPAMDGRGLSVGLGGYRGWIPPARLARAGLRRLYLHPEFARELGEHPWAEHRLADLLQRARAVGLDVVVTDLRTRRALAAALSAGAQAATGPLFHPR